MKKIGLSFIFTILFCSLSIASANAATSSEYEFVNNQGVIIKSSVVNEISKNISAKYFDNMSQKTYDNFESMVEKGYNVSTTFQVQRNLVKNGVVLYSKTMDMSEKEYKEYSSMTPMGAGKCDDGQDCWETFTKQLILFTSNSSSVLNIELVCVWLDEPTVKSNDVIAIRYDGTAKVTWSLIEGTQYWDIYENAKYYFKNSNETQVFSNGIGMSMDLVDSSNHFSLILTASGDYTGKVNTVYGSYQHANVNTTLAESKQYTLSSSGLGGVIKFNTTALSNRYEGMQGVKYTF